MRSSLLALVLLAAACGPASVRITGGHAAVAHDAGRSVKVLTINLQNSAIHPNGPARLQRIADVINDLEPDLVSLQEAVRQGSGPNDAQALAQLTGYHWLWKRTHQTSLFEEGPGVLSRWPIGWKESVMLPHPELGGIFKRAVIGARVATPRGPVQLFATHFSVDPDETQRLDQAKAAVEFIAAHPSDLPGFFAGDLNAEPTAASQQFLRGELAYQGVTSNLADAWTAANGSAPGLTIPASEPSQRIDYVYAVPGTRGSARVRECRVLFEHPLLGLYASDHLGVMCTFDMP